MKEKIRKRAHLANEKNLFIRIVAHIVSMISDRYTVCFYEKNRHMIHIYKHTYYERVREPFN